MKQDQVVLLVKFQSALSPEKLLETCVTRQDDFRNVPGLIQKHYLLEEGSGAISGCYIFRDTASREAFWNSDLARDIPARYGGIPGSFRVERYGLAITLNE